MKLSDLLILALCIGCFVLSRAQDKQSTTEQKAGPQNAKTDEKRPDQKDSQIPRGPIDILSDTGGLDVHPYLDRALSLIRGNWYARIPQSAELKRGKVSINFTISKDGQINDVLYADRSGDTVLDRAAFLAITGSSPLPSLPSDYRCKDIHLQIHFYYNLQPDSPSKPPTTLIPCVASRVGSVQPIAISVSPMSADVVTRGMQQFVAKIGENSSEEVIWTLSGLGCSGSTCGSVSAQGLYLAPSGVPDPAMVSITATLKSDPTGKATATVTIVQPAKR